MFRSLLKNIRNLPFLNKAIRSTLNFSASTIYKLESHWRVSGIVDIQFDGMEIPFYTESDDDLVDTLYYNKEYYEYNDLSLFVHLARVSKNIIDVGANTGLYSILSATASPDATVFAFEPNPTNHKRLQKNIELNQLKNIKVIQNAVGDSAKPISFTIPKDERISYTSSVLGDFSKSTHGGQLEWKEITVPQATLDTFFKDSFNQIDLLKIDVEGYELAVFEGGKTFFQNNSPVVLCEIFLNEEKRTYFQNFLQRYDYTAYMILKDGLLRLDKELIPNLDGNNFLFSRGRTEHTFTSFKHMTKIREELLHKAPMTWQA
jgi:FkbM family methyltransferase